MPSVRNTKLHRRKSKVVKKSDRKKIMVFTREEFETITTVLAVITATSSDANTRLKCDRALKAFRRAGRSIRSSKDGRAKKACQSGVSVYIGVDHE
jgi:hypothetical protein